MPHAEKGKGKDDAEKAADAVVSCFEFADADAERGRDFLYEKLVGLRREVGVEHERHTQGAEQRAGQKEDDAPGDAHRGEQADERHASVERKAIENRREKREQIGEAEPPEQGSHEKQDDGLQRVFHHAERHELPCCGELQVKHISGGDDHGHAEVRTLHKGGAKRNGKDAEEVGKFCVKRFFLHTTNAPETER